MGNRTRTVQNDVTCSCDDSRRCPARSLGCYSDLHGVLDGCGGSARQVLLVCISGCTEDTMFLSDLCHKGPEAFDLEGRLYRPKSLDEMVKVTDAVVPKSIKGVYYHGRYPVDYYFYQQYGQSVYASFTAPFELMPPNMWAPGEPNNCNPICDQFCINGGQWSGE